MLIIKNGKIYTYCKGNYRLFFLPNYLLIPYHVLATTFESIGWWKIRDLIMLFLIANKKAWTKDDALNFITLKDYLIVLPEF